MSQVKDRIDVLLDIFLGAAYADRQLAGRERHHIGDLVRDLLCTRDLPAAIQHRIDGFDVTRFDLTRCAQQFAADPPMSKRRLLELVAQVISADGVYDLAEDDYLRALARALDVPAAEIGDLTLDYEVHELRESFEQLRASAPDDAAQQQAAQPHR